MSERGEKYTDNRFVLFGGIGAAIAALRCFTPLLVWGLAAAGLVGLVGYVDYALLPLLAVALIATYIGVEQVRKRRAACTDDSCEVPQRSTEAGG